MAMANTLTSLGFVISTVINSFKTLSDPDVGNTEKLIAGFTALGMVMSMLTSIFNK
jgi:hypothetical protein